MKLKIIGLIILLFACVQINAQSKVGTVDSEYIISKMPEMTAVQARIKSYGAKLDSTFAIKVKAYDAKVAAFKKAEKALTEAAKKTKYTEIAGLNQDLQKYRQNGTKMMQLRSDELKRPLYKKLSKTINEVAKANNFTQILTLSGNEFAYIDLKFDITKLVMDKLGIKEDVATKK